MDFSAQLDDLQQRAADAKASAQAAVSESREQLRQRIDQAKAEVDQAATDARQDAAAAAAVVIGVFVSTAHSCRHPKIGMRSCTSRRTVPALRYA